MTLRTFIAASVLIHAAVLAAWPPHLPAPGGGVTTLHVALLDAPDPAPVQTQPAPVHKTVGSKPTAAIHTAKDDKHVDSKLRQHVPAGPLRAVSFKTIQHSDASRRAAATAKPQQTEPAPRAKTGKPAQVAAADPQPSNPAAPARVNEGEVVSRLQSSLHHRFNARFDYPLIARIKGWQGQVTLGLRVEPDGTLTHLRVINTSGYAILDQASLRTLKGIARVPPAADWLGGRHVDLELPVEYRLTEGG